MFSTPKASRIPIPEVFDGVAGGESTWSVVRLGLQIPYFHVRYIGPEVGGDLSEGLLLLTSIEQLQGLLAEPTIDVVETQIVSPGFLNRSGRWKMEPLKAIYRGFESNGEHQQPVLVYLLRDGSRYLDAFIAQDEAEISDLHKLFEIEETTECESR